MVTLGCLFVSVGIAFWVWVKLRRVFRLARVTVTQDGQPTGELPSVSLCIPARNEMHAMNDCLESALRTDYQKLEIIVLDDGSRDDTLALIKSFAYAGVRFVEGSPLPEGWLGKNHALEGLAQEASGKLLLFADVDTRFSPKSISQAVAYMQQQSADMISILPTRHNPSRMSAIVATMRHFWNLLSHTPAHPAVSSSAWMIKREVLIEKLHGLSDVKLAVRPEKRLAAMVAQFGVYRFVISTPLLGISYEKKLSSQYETATRIYYPDFGLVGVIARVAGLLACLLPFVLFFVFLAVGDFGHTVLFFAATVVVAIVNAWYLSALRATDSVIATISLPFILVREIWLLCYSVFAYVAHRVTWKGRAVRLRGPGSPAN